MAVVPGELDAPQPWEPQVVSVAGGVQVLTSHQMLWAFGERAAADSWQPRALQRALRRPSPSETNQSPAAAPGRATSPEAIVLTARPRDYEKVGLPEP